MSLFKKAANPIFTTHELPIPIPSSSGTSGISEQPELSEERVTSLSEDKFWSAIDKIRWTDASEHKMNVKATRLVLSTYLSASELSEFKNRLRKNMDDLEKNMRKCGYSNTNDEFLSHIVGKGKLFYYNVLDDSEFATYLLAGDTQNLWTILDT